jgi:hypothetical protein
VPAHGGAQVNVRFCVEDVREGLWADVPGEFLDLLDVATYVYAADQAVTRGGYRDEGMGHRWRRRLHLAVAVRDPARWSSPSVREQLERTLSFLSEDEYRFRFERLSEAPAGRYLRFSSDRFGGAVEEVMLFSGGLDSLAGAALRAVKEGRQILMAHHLSNPKLAPVVRGLTEELGRRQRCRPPILLPVRIDKGSKLSREPTQRTRSFLFAALGATFAGCLGLGRVSFDENGVTGPNLPPCAQVVGSRASRTTHPRALADFSPMGRPTCE